MSEAPRQARAPRREIAKVNIESPNVTVRFSDSGKEVGLDASKIPGANGIASTALAVLTHGVAAILRASYSNNDTPEESAAAVRDQLLKGEWRRGKISSEPDAVVEALSQHLDKDVEYIEEVYLPAYCLKQDHVASNGRLLIAHAKRELEKHPALAPVVGKILAARAKRAQASGQAQTAPSLEI